MTDSRVKLWDPDDRFMMPLIGQLVTFNEQGDLWPARVVREEAKAAPVWLLYSSQAPNAPSNLVGVYSSLMAAKQGTGREREWHWQPAAVMPAYTTPGYWYAVDLGALTYGWMISEEQVQG